MANFNELAKIFAFNWQKLALMESLAEVYCEGDDGKIVNSNIDE